MNSPLGVLFTNLYMGSTESAAVKKYHLAIYAKYVNDVFVCAKNINEMLSLREDLKTTAILNLTYVESRECRLSFLDILVAAQENGFLTSANAKETTTGYCLNGNSECPTIHQLNDQRVHQACVNPLLSMEMCPKRTEKDYKSPCI